MVFYFLYNGFYDVGLYFKALSSLPTTMALNNLLSVFVGDAAGIRLFVP